MIACVRVICEVRVSVIAAVRACCVERFGVSELSVSIRVTSVLNDGYVHEAPAQWWPRSKNRKEA